jgi:hemerythrin-like domain-containing protein
MEIRKLLREPDDFELTLYQLEDALNLLERSATATGQSLTALAKGFAQALTADDADAHEGSVRKLRSLQPMDVSDVLTEAHRLLHDLHERYRKVKESEAEMQRLAIDAIKERAR